jgi:DNA-cytosine methyltransferase
MQKLKVLDLFSGIGNFSRGLEVSGFFETVAFVEIDKDCHTVLQKHWPQVPILEDVSKITFNDYKGKFTPVIGGSVVGDIDVICGGFPCQDISVAGKKKGITNETRSGLWFQYKRLIKEIKPRYVFIENVANLLNNGFAAVLKDLHELGYDAEWGIISARSIGANHLRKRIWIVAYPNSERQWRIQSGRSSGKSGEETIWTGRASQIGTTSNPNNFRFWRSFTSEEEKFQWWTEATFSLRTVFRQITEIEPTVCRSNDGTSPRPHTDRRRNLLKKEIRKSETRIEQLRKQRIKQLGNSLVPQIAQFIGEQIKSYELGKEKINEIVND